MHCFSTNTAEIVSYEEIKKLPGKSDTVLIDVREPQELKDTGVVPTSINIPCKLAFHEMTPCDNNAFLQ